MLLGQLLLLLLLQLLGCSVAQIARAVSAAGSLLPVHFARVLAEVQLGKILAERLDALRGAASTSVHHAIGPLAGFDLEMQMVQAKSKSASAT